MPSTTCPHRRRQFRVLDDTVPTGMGGIDDHYNYFSNRRLNALVQQASVSIHVLCTAASPNSRSRSLSAGITEATVSSTSAGGRILFPLADGPISRWQRREVVPSR